MLTPTAGGPRRGHTAHRPESFSEWIFTHDFSSGKSPCAFPPDGPLPRRGSSTALPGTTRAALHGSPRLPTASGSPPPSPTEGAPWHLQALMVPVPASGSERPAGGRQGFRGRVQARGYAAENPQASPEHFRSRSSITASGLFTVSSQNAPPQAYWEPVPKAPPHAHRCPSSRQ